MCTRNTGRIALAARALLVPPLSIIAFSLFTVPAAYAQSVTANGVGAGDIVGTDASSHLIGINSATTATGLTFNSSGPNNVVIDGNGITLNSNAQLNTNGGNIDSFGAQLKAAQLGCFSGPNCQTNIDTSGNLTTGSATAATFNGTVKVTSLGTPTAGGSYVVLSDPTGQLTSQALTSVKTDSATAASDGAGPVFTSSIASATGKFATATGVGAQANVDYGSAYGSSATAKYFGTAVGYNAMATGDFSSAFGQNAQATGVGSLASGSSSQANGRSAAAYGDGAVAGGDYSIAIGQGATANYAGSVAIGQGASTSAANQIAIGTGSNTYTLAGLGGTGGGLVQSDNSGNLSVTASPTLTGLTVTGTTNLQGTTNFGTMGQTTIDNSGNVGVGGTLGVTGLATFNGGTQTNGSAVVTGNTATGTLTVVNNATVGGNLGVTGNAIVGGTQTITGQSFLNGGATVSNNFTVNPNTAVNFGGNVVGGVGTPVLPTDAANKAYVDATINAANRRIDKTDQGVAIALSLQNPVLTGGDLFGVSANWGDFQGNNAFGLSAVGIIGRNWFGAGEKVGLTGGFGISDSQVAGRAGLQFTW